MAAVLRQMNKASVVLVRMELENLIGLAFSNFLQQEKLALLGHDLKKMLVGLGRQE